MCVRGTVLVGVAVAVSLAVPATAAASAGSSGVAVAGPCSGIADFEAVVVDEGTTGRLRFVVSNAAARSRWRLTLRDDQGDTGSVLTATMRANAEGRWLVRTGVAQGRHRFGIRAVSRAGQVCAVRFRATV
jgi:hypothetical protein